MRPLSSLVVLSLVAVVVVVCILSSTLASAEPRSTPRLQASITPSSSIDLKGVKQGPIGFNGLWTDEDLATIFVAVAAFRDKLCHRTMSHMFKVARNPHRIFAGIIEQNEPGDQICPPVPEFYDCRSTEFCPMDNLRRRRVVSRRGKGPTYGRYVSSLLYRGETFYMMIDSHCQFAHHWDSWSIGNLFKSRSSRPVISHYPNGWNDDNTTYDSSGNAIVMCNGHYISMGYIRMDGRWMNRCIEPRKQPFTAAGYLFGTADMWHLAPFDPHLDYIFDGEEILYSVRLWTHGLDIFTASALIAHNYARHRHLGYYRHWDVQNEIPNNSGWHNEVTISQQRASLMMEIPKENSTVLMVDRNAKDLHPRILKEFDKYTIGKLRSMEEYNHFAMINPYARKASDTLCKKLEHETITKSAQ